MGPVTWSRPGFFSIRKQRKYVFPASVRGLVGLSHSWDSALDARMRLSAQHPAGGPGGGEDLAQLRRLRRDSGCRRRSPPRPQPDPGTQAPAPRPPRLGHSSR